MEWFVHTHIHTKKEREKMKKRMNIILSVSVIKHVRQIVAELNRLHPMAHHSISSVIEDLINKSTIGKLDFLKEQKKVLLTQLAIIDEEVKRIKEALKEEKEC
jgi:hypothetical protein